MRDVATSTKVPGIVRILRGLGIVAALLCLLVADSASAQPAALPASDARASALRALGEAYAKDVGLTLVKAESAVTGTVDVPATWSERLESSLAVGYTPRAGVFIALPFARLRSMLRVRAGQGRSPEEALRRVVTPGAVVVQSTWHFAGAEPVRSYAVFSPAGVPQFETLLSMPALQGPVFSVGH